jgi:hypothetical protein
MKLQEAKRIIRKLIGGWADQKLAAVYAFNEDGKMSYFGTCNCLIGVHSSEVLHTVCRDAEGFQSGHYADAIGGLQREEAAYLILGGTYGDAIKEACAPEAVKEACAPEAVRAERRRLRQVRFSAILRAEMRRRQRAADDEPEFPDPAQPDVYTPEEIAHAL